MSKQYYLEKQTSGRGMINVTVEVSAHVHESGVVTGLCNIFLHHTSASLVLCENFDPLVQRDMEAFMAHLTPDGNPLFQHIAEGPDDMPSHVRTMLTQSFQTIPITEGQLALGKWQGVYLWEHRVKGHRRRMTVTIL